MYYDLSLLPTNTIELLHLLKSITEGAYRAAAIDYQFTDCTITPPPQNFNLIKNSPHSIKLYNRATLTIEQNATLHQLNQVQNNGYDIVAVKPKTQSIFHLLCVEYDKNYDIITLDMGRKLPFMLKRNPVYEALRKGKYFELQYHPILDQNTRVVCMTNMINVIKATGGKNIIVSSHTGNFKTHRTPYDVAALMSSLGLSKNLALTTMKENAQDLIKRSYHRKFFKSAIQVVPQQTVRKLSKKIKKHRDNIKKIGMIKQ